jgi:D-glucosaminate-6-phosphate ammonia-lyase
MDRGRSGKISETLGVSAIINVAGTMTALGASIIVPEAIASMAGIAPEFVRMEELQRSASLAIARATGAEAGCVTASAAAGITLCVAATMTGADLAAIERLPSVAGRKHEVLIQMGHMVNYGAPVEQSIRLAGGTPIPVGAATGAALYQLEGAISERTAAALYVVSHHTVQYGLIPLDAFAAACHARDVPVIVDAASEYDLRGFLAQGADLVIYSGHKFLGGPTSGIIAGRKHLVRAAYLQNRGIGRGMKAGKESIAGLIAALEAWESRDHAAIRGGERAALDLWQKTLEPFPAVRTALVPDPTGNPLDRLEVRAAPDADFTVKDLAAALQSGDPSIVVRDDEIDRGFFELDPCNLHPGEAEIVARRLAQILGGPIPHCPATSADATDLLFRWPD